MKASFYNIYFEHNGKNYVYNTLSTAIAELDHDVITALKNDDLNKIDKNTILSLTDSLFINGDNAQEYKKYLYFFDATRFNKSAQSLYINLIPSYNCNLACPYCYEGSKKRNSVMSNETLDIIEKFFANKISEAQFIKNIIVRFYGGEPLLNKEHLFKFARFTFLKAKEQGIQIKYDMPSNFTLVDDDVLDFIKTYNISLQVTLDGDKENHDRRRIMKDGKGTWDIIVNNLKRANEFGIKDNITIRINIDKYNIGAAEKVLDEIMPYSNYIYFGLLENYTGYNDHYSSKCLECESYSNIISNKLNPILIKYGLPPAVPFGKHSPCALYSENKFFIDCDLNVYKCEILVNRKDCAVGTISKEGIFIPNDNFYQQMYFSPKLFTKCIECKLLPLCGGGCPGKKYLSERLTNGHFEQYNCEFDTLSLIDFLKFYIDHPDDSE